MPNLPSLTLISSAPLPDSWVEKMLDEMLLSYGKKFIDQWQGVDTDKLVAHWARQMADFTGPEIRKGLDALDTREWPPSLPEFKKMCRTPIDPMVAYYEALTGLQARAKGASGLWSHPAVYWAAAGLSFDLLNQTFSAIKVRWEKALADQLDKGTWEAIPAPMVALNAPDKSWTKQAATETLKAIGASELLQAKTDHHRWWKKILQREADGDKTVTTYQLREARLAMAGQA